MIRSHPRLAWLGAGLFALAALFCVPLALEANSLLFAAEDPVAITDRALTRAFDGTVAAHEIQSALDANDADLAASFVDLAADQGVALEPELKQRVAAAVEQANSAAAAAGSFASGLITGEPKDMAGLAGTALGDLFVFGDIRDAIARAAATPAARITTNSCWGWPRSASRSPQEPTRRPALRRRRVLVSRR